MQNSSGFMRNRMASNVKPMCKYGASCFRKNRLHLESYEHAKTEAADATADDLDVSKNDEHGENKENREDLSNKTFEMRSDDELDSEKIEKVDLSKVTGESLFYE